MNIVNISNLFNQICLGINVAAPNTIGFYHYGWYSDINANVSNNWTGNNDLGRLYPAVQLMYPTATIDIKEKSVKGSIDCRMVVSAPQYYENNAQYKDESIIETQAKLEALAINILSEYNRIARTMQTGIQNPITIDYLSDAHNENLVLLDIKFRIWYVWDCPTITADIAGLPAPFDTLPPIDTDLEKQQLNIGIPPTNIVNPKIAGAGLVNTKTDVIDNGTWAGDLPITFTYQWQRNSIDIVGETGTQYTTVLADLGLGIACLVTATNIAGSAIAQSNVIKIS
jgi:hypothetical protein